MADIIKLIPNWSESFTYHDETPGIFIGRANEVASLKFALENNNSGAFLVSAVRGVGKTSFVHKVLSESNRLYPIFVNAGHVLTTASEEAPAKKNLLVSLIRSAYFEFKENEGIQALYKQSIGSFKKHATSTNSKEAIEEKSSSMVLKLNLRTILSAIALIVTATGIIVPDNLAKIIGILALVSIPIIVTYKSTTKDSNTSTASHELIIEDSIDYLELGFEEWLRGQGKKLVFVIDELDKIDEKKALELVKEYKNLFSRSCAHYIFIASERAYQLIKEDREATPTEGGIFPTLFTHAYYLPLPTSSELRSYLVHIFEDSSHGYSEFKDYLLFKGKNDFFLLKKLISDLIVVEDNTALIYTKAIVKADPNFHRAVKVYNYASLFCEKHYKKNKLYWENNSLMQKNIFEFLNQNIQSSFEVPLEHSSSDIKGLVMYLQRLGVLQKGESYVPDFDSQTHTRFNWISNYRSLTSPDQLFEEEETFVKTFEQMIQVANDIDDLPNGNFNKYNTITEGRDGSTVSGIELYNAYKDYLSLYTAVKNPDKRISVLLEDVTAATEQIKNQLNNVKKLHFKVLAECVSQSLSRAPTVYKNMDFSLRHNAFVQYPRFVNLVQQGEYRLFGLDDGSRELIICKDIQNIPSVSIELAKLKNDSTKLVLNLSTENEITELHPIIYIDSLNRRRRKGISVKNFYNIPIDKDFQSLAKGITIVCEYFSLPYPFVDR